VFYALYKHFKLKLEMFFTYFFNLVIYFGTQHTSTPGLSQCLKLKLRNIVTNILIICAILLSYII